MPPRPLLVVLVLALAGCVRLVGGSGEGGAADRGARDRAAELARDAPADRATEARADAPASEGPLADAKPLDAKKPPDAKPPDAKPPDAKKPDGPKPDQKAKPDLAKTIPGVWKAVGSGIFMMGSPPSEPCRGANETEHQVTLALGYSIQSTEVTQAQFLEVMGYNPSYHTGCPDCPVETVSWHEAAAYCNALSSRAGISLCYTCTGSQAAVSCSEAPGYQGAGVYMCMSYRLPTEAEWEKAYRAGTTTGYYNAVVNPAMCGACTPMDPNVDAIAWHCGNAAGATHPVGGKAQNALFLRDMAGNVREWCHDWYQDDLGSVAVAMPWGAAPGSSSTRVARGGAFGTNAADVRAAARDHFPPGDRSASVGFRCVRH